MNARVVLCATILVLTCADAALAKDRLAPQAEVDKMKADAAAIPDGTLGPAATAALAVETSILPGPRPGEVAFEMPWDGYCLKENHCNVTWTENASLIPKGQNVFEVDATYFFGLDSNWTFAPDWFGFLIADRSGLIVMPDRNGKLSALSIDGLSAGEPGKPPVITAAKFTYQNAISATSYSCRFSVSSGTVHEGCDALGGIKWNEDKRGRVFFTTLENLKSDSSDFEYNAVFNSYLLINGFGNQCVAESCKGDAYPFQTYSHKVIDYKPVGGDWHSKAVSAALSTADKQRAQALFAAGYDDYKASNFVSAAALLQRGLAIDPANYRATYALAEVARSINQSGGGGAWYTGLAFHYYRRTVDLAPPDAIEAIRSQAHLDAKSIQ